MWKYEYKYGKGKIKLHNMADHYIDFIKEHRCLYGFSEESVEKLVGLIGNTKVMGN